MANPPLRLESLQNPRLKALVRLKERRAREREGRFLIEGARELSRALEAGVSVQNVYVCPDLLSEEGRALLGRVTGVTELSEGAFRKLSMREHPDGIVGVAPIETADLTALSLPQDALVLVLDGLEKPGNLGALLRTADGAGVQAVFVTGQGTDLYNPNVIRSSMGSLFSQPVLPVTPDRLRDWLERNGYQVVAATPHANQRYWDLDYRGRTAIVLGTEHQGLSPFWEQVASTRVSIPMKGQADSLNVATAGALLIYEALRQRLQV